MSEIKVSLLDKDDNRHSFEVTVSEGESSTIHRVEIDEDYYKYLTDGVIVPVDLVKKSFKFLLVREPKESILKQFNLREISRYFSEYEKEIKK